ncbi:MAG: guanylate kinase [Zetaproteobacteria bacterium]|nr:guanylate kinase [Zetaproteobacteria bacterium]
MSHGRLFIVSGPSGAGKSSLCAALLKDLPHVVLSISSTTRAPRPGEMDGREYHFLTPEAFALAQRQGAFLEWANVHGNAYGTRAADIQSQLQAGHDVLLEIDWQGADQVASRMGDAVRIFILPPSIEALRERLTKRGQDSDAVIMRRVEAAEQEMAHAHKAEYQIVNEDFAQSLAELKAIFTQK